MQLRSEIPFYYRVKSGQTCRDVAAAFHVPLPLLCRENALSEEPRAGTVLLIPQHCGNEYRVRGGESRALLCGSAEAFVKRNGTSALFPGQSVFLG